MGFFPDAFPRPGSILSDARNGNVLSAAEMQIIIVQKGKGSLVGSEGIFLSEVKEKDGRNGGYVCSPRILMGSARLCV